MKPLNYQYMCKKYWFSFENKKINLKSFEAIPLKTENFPSDKFVFCYIFVLAIPTSLQKSSPLVSTVNAATLFRISLEVVQDFCQMLQGVFSFLWQIIRGYQQPSSKYMLLAKVANSLWGSGQRLADALRLPIANVSEECQQPLKHLQGGQPV